MKVLTIFHSISADPQNLTAITTLATIGILESDDTLVDAALMEIRGLTWDKITELDPTYLVSQLVIQHHLAQVSILPNNLKGSYFMLFRDEHRTRCRMLSAWFT